MRGAVGRGIATLVGAATVAVLATPGAGASPVPVFTAISAGGGHTCVLTSGGGVKCWGSNRFGQLGNGVQRKCNQYGKCTQPYSRVPVDVVGLSSGVRAIAAGGSHTCALTTQGAVKCWGYNASGQLGNGAKIKCDDQGSCAKYVSSTPVAVVGLGSGVRAIAVGDFQSCAITVSGGVKCWGEGMCDFAGSNTSACGTPVGVSGMTSGISAIAAGAASICAISSSGGVTCMPGLASGVTAISLGLVAGRSRGEGGSENGCALTSAGGVKCWGPNYLGQLGNGSKTASRTPVDVVGLASGVRAIASGDSYSCAITNPGGVKCWGNNSSGTLGDGSTIHRSTPVDVAGLTSSVTAVDAGVYHACAIVGGHEIRCWGSNVDGRLGLQATARTSATPVDVPFTAQPAASPRTTSPAGSSAAGRCSEAEATRVVERLHLGNADDPDVSNPVAQVLCGAFVGPGSQAMVASLAIPSCGRTGGWVVFRRSGATWQLVMERNNGADLDVVGTGIRETQFVLRPGDAHCFPTGGTRSRTWRWNGTRFVSSPWTRSKPAAPATPVAGASAFGFFQTPSRNILCGYSYNASKANVGCVVKSGLNPQPAPRRPGCSPPLTVALRTTGRAFVTDETCPGEDAPETPYVGSGIAKVLAYGTTWSGGGLRCTSAETGLTCRNKSGHGFFLSRERWRSF